MKKSNKLLSLLLGGASATILAATAYAANVDIPPGNLADALDTYTTQTGVALIVSDAVTQGLHTRGAKGDLTADQALTRILRGTGLAQRPMSGAVMIVPANELAKPADHSEQVTPIRVAAAASASVETVVVTSSKIKGDIQTVPIAITALSQEQLTSRQIAGGPDLVKEVPNLTFSKTNFTGYNIQIRGIGTQAISVTTDPAVAVAFNDTPFIRNHFFEQEFYDVNQVEVLRGPQGTLYGRNATAGVVNVVSAKPTDQFEAMLSADWGNYHNRRYEGMVNIPIVDDRADLRIAGEWTKRKGYTTNALTGAQVDGRDLWSSRVTLGFKPTEDLQAYLVWEHFSENDDRMRTAKQLCKTDPGPSQVDGVPVESSGTNNAYEAINYISQGCLPTSLYSPSAFQVPNGYSLPFYDSLGSIGIPITAHDGLEFDPYASTVQSRNLRVIETTLNPQYKAKNDTVELNADYHVTPSLTFSSQTGYNNDFLWSTEDYNRFNTAPGAFLYYTPGPGNQNSLNPNAFGQIIPDPNGLLVCSSNSIPGEFCGTAPVGAPCPEVNYTCQQAGMFCDPQLGCSDRLVAQDLSDEHAWQLSQEFRLASNFSGPLNFSIGGNYLHYTTEENYYVFINVLTLAAYSWPHQGQGDLQQTLPWVSGVSDNANCLTGGLMMPNLDQPHALETEGGSPCMYIDPNPLTSLNNQGHNYFLSQNPYALNSYAGFGEVYYNVTNDLKLTGGLRWTDDQKHFVDIPSELLVAGYGYPVLRVVDQQWNQLTGRAAVNWTPKLDFTDQTLVYGSYAHGYKAGGANPPGAELLAIDSFDTSNPIHPLTFKPEFIDAFELGSKNTLLDGALTLNGDVFYYIYKNYQISRIVDRTAINDNFNAHVRGAELEASWEPAPGLKFNFAGGYENATLDEGDKSIDLMDRTAGNPNWMVIKPFVTQASNCVLPTYVVAAILAASNYNRGLTPNEGGLGGACEKAYTGHLDPLAEEAYFLPPGYNYPGFDPVSATATNNGAGPAPNNGEGFYKNLSGNQLPNTPHFTTSLAADYTLPVSEDWAATLHSDFYWQSQSFARVFNDRPYDKLRGYSTTNFALILTSASGWQVMGYVKNVFNVTAITGDFLNSDDSGLTTNVFLTDPRLYGVRVTKNF